ncbi:MAG: SurA N-terminal domain-containing protein [bacterium]
MDKKFKNIKLYIFTIFTVSFLSFIILSLYAVSSYGLLIDEIAASVDNTPITLNELYFLYNFNSINNLKYRKISKTISGNNLKHTLEIYINRLLILKQEQKTGALSASQAQVNSFIGVFEKKFKILHKHIDFDSFLAKFGFSKETFYIFSRNILLEKVFINKRLHFFLFTIENSGKLSGGAKQKYSGALSLKLKNFLLNLKKHAEIEINDNFN